MFLGICDEILINSNPFGVSPTALIAPDFSSFGGIVKWGKCPYLGPWAINEKNMDTFFSSTFKV